MTKRISAFILSFAFSLLVAAPPLLQGKHALQEPMVKRNVYPADADAKTEIAEALGRAAKSDKRVLLVFGANWCLDCHVLDQALRTGDSGKLAEQYYEVVHVDIGRGEKNVDLAKQYKVDLEKGVPNVAVLDAQGKLLTSSSAFESARNMDEQQVIDFLNKWKAKKKAA